MASKASEIIIDLQLQKLCADIIDEIEKWPHVETAQQNAYTGHKCWIVGYVSGFQGRRKRLKFISIGIRKSGFVVEQNPKTRKNKKITCKEDWDEEKKAVKLRYDQLIAKRTS